MATKKIAKKVTAKKAAPKVASKSNNQKKAVAKTAPVSKKALSPKKITSSKPAIKKITTKKAAVKPAPVKKVAVKASPVIAKKIALKKAIIKTVKTVKPQEAAPAIVVEPITDVKFLDFAQKQKQRLLDLRDELLDAMNGVTRDTIRNAPEGSEASGSGMHQGDAGSDAYDRDFALSVLAKEQDALYEIAEALDRIKKRTYGICEMSGKRIPLTRLEAIPFARLTVECQGQWEKEYGSRKFRPNGAVGFSGGGIFDDDEDSETLSLDEDDD
jgi:DnaK suppressor protein